MKFMTYFQAPILIFTLLLFPTTLLAESRAILIVHSYSQEYEWTRGQHEGFVSELKARSQDDLLISTEYLDTKRRAYTPGYASLMAQNIGNKYRNYHPELIYITDDNALGFGLEHLSRLFPGTPIIFSGVNNDHALEHTQLTNITGVFEKKELTPNIELIRALGGDTTQVTLLGDNSNTHHSIIHDVQKELALMPDVEARIIATENIEEAIKQLQLCGCEYLILTTIGNIRSQDGQPMSLQGIIASLASAFNGLIITMEDGYLLDNVIGGYVTSSHATGKTAASLALQVLKGIPANSLPRTPRPNTYIFNDKELHKYGLELPEEIRRASQIINPLPGFYVSHRGLILSSLAILAALLITTLAVSVVFMARSREQLKQTSKELVKQKDKLLETRTSLEMAQHLAQIGSWQLDHTTNELVWSDEIYRIFEINKSEFGASYEAFLSAIHPDDKDSVNRAFSESVKNRSHYDVEHRLLMPDGRVKYVHEKGTTTYDSHNLPKLSYGTIQDITRKVEADKRLKQWGSIFENTIEAVVITDQDLNIIDVNRAYTDITGYSKQEVIGKRKLGIRRSDRHEDDFYENIWKCVNEKGDWSGEIWNRKKNGELSPEWHSISAIRDEHGNVVNYVGVFTDISVLKHSEEKLEHLANHDPLTGLANRTLLSDRLSNSIKRANRNRSRLAILYLDLDRFKKVNDTLGHIIGDSLLQETAERLRLNIRESDTIGRLGGDEFLIILEDYSSVNDIRVVSDKLRKALEQPFEIEGHKLFISVSIGVSLYPADGEEGMELIRNADSALFNAKRMGRNHLSFYDAEITRHAESKLLIENTLRNAYENGHFELHYQAKVDLSNDNIIGAEILLRLKQTDAPHFYPDQFIPVAEETGLIIPIGEWVLHQAARKLSEWKQQGINLQIAVNLSAIQIQRGEILETLKLLRAKYDFDPVMMEIEVTESVLIDFPEKAVEVLSGIRNMGFSLALDDFGTGFSSLSNLKRYPFSTIKVDKSFVLDILENPNDEAITRAVVAMGGSLDMKVVAEGAETIDQVNFLKTIRCDQAQGYYYSKPVPVEDFLNLCASENISTPVH